MSRMTLGELRVLHVMVERFATEQDLDAHDEVAILTRSADSDRAPWIEFTVGARRFGIWRRTLAVYEADEHGAMGDEPVAEP